MSTSKVLAIPAVAAFIGLVLIGASIYWTSTLGPRPAWSEQQAAAHARAAAEYHQLAHQAAHQHSEERDSPHPGTVEDVDAARRRFESQQQKLMMAKEVHQFQAALLKWSGIALATLGAAGMFLLREKDGGS